MLSAPWLDVTVPVSPDSPVWPGDPSPVITAVARHDGGDTYHLTEVFMGVHSGTHIDAPLHFIAEGKDITQLDLTRMMGTVRILDATAIHRISADWLSGHSFDLDEKIIFKTIADTANRSDFMNESDFTALDEKAAKFLVEKGITLVGIDGLSIAVGDELTQTHRRLLESEVIIIEHLNLHGILPGLYEIIALPMLIAGSEAAPARVLLRKRQDAG